LSPHRAILTDVPAALAMRDSWSGDASDAS
jgi:hypothetical protein